MKLFRLPYFSGFLYPEAIFRIKTTKKVLYLTFDDGPDPESTQKLLEILRKHSIKAVFFCSGMKAETYPYLIAQIKSEGHLVGNHGYSHLNGWLTTSVNYISDIETAAVFTSGSLFRPPFGKLKLSQYRRLSKSYKIVFWDLIPYDFDSSFGPENSLRILKKKIRKGSVIVLHDTNKSCANTILEEFILFAKGEGYTFRTI